jgi:hypothetical protein
MATRRRCGCPYRLALLEPLVTILSGRPAAPLAALSVIAEARPAPGVTRLVPVRVDGTPTTAGACPEAAVHQWPKQTGSVRSLPEFPARRASLAGLFDWE